MKKITYADDGDIGFTYGTNKPQYKAVTEGNVCNSFECSLIR